MATSSNVESLTPLDTLMPRTYIATLLTFRTTESNSTVKEELQTGLECLFRQLPWLAGRVFPATSTQGQKPSLEIRWDRSNTFPYLIDKGSIPVEYEALSLAGLPPALIPPDIWPAPSMIDESLFLEGAPVFATSFFRFRDNRGLGLCVCMHHHAVDATGFAAVLKLWADNTTGVKGHVLNPAGGRLERLSNALSSDLEGVANMSLDVLFTRHSEYSKLPPALPSSSPPCTCKLFTFPVARINEVKRSLEEHSSGTQTTNSVLCATIWSAVTCVRTERNPNLKEGTSRLITAVNGRRRVSDEIASSANPYLGNVVLYSVSRLAVEDLVAAFDQPAKQSLLIVCNTISRSQSPSIINSRFVAEVYRLAQNVIDYRTIFVGWDLFGARDLTITSWADLGLYEMQFGPRLGKPEFVRVRHADADGVAIILPRKKSWSGASGTGAFNEVVEVMLMLRTDDMDALEQNSTWKGLTS
ncbi:hypothetical protein VTK73DRAFT_1554 [Phialemonium thermophilum]|uniref:Uncharacterized protein n=1 Tax=Phialemonium thermophilum TaxID=223376 RepID=A0ABR3X9M6_9PEZI